MSKFKDFYKNNDKKETSQAARRAKLLEEQKQKRQLEYSSGRDEENEIYEKFHYKINQDYKNILMLSEWMVELPEDLEDFVLVPCPKGIRCILAVKSHAKLHYKNGKEFMTGIKTNIPKDTILDCIYDKNSSIIYILDILQYKGRDFVNCDFAFRSYWIRSKFSEEEFSFYNKDITLKVIETFDFNDPISIHKCYETHPIFTDKTELDGFLYYHKEGSYTFGESPLVLWLFSFMVEDVMPIYKVHPYYNSLKPENYSDYHQYITDFNDKLKKKSRRSKGSEMECETSTEIIDEDPVQQSIDLEKYGEF